MENWSDLPIIHDEILPCAHCNGLLTPHHCVTYKDADYRTCNRCNTRTTWKPDTDHHLLQTNTTIPDKTKEISDFKRTNPRKYRKRHRVG